MTDREEELTREVERLREALEAVKQRSKEVHDLYDKNGPQWTSRATGHEYADMSYVLDVADEYAAIAVAALAGKDAK